MVNRNCLNAMLVLAGSVLFASSVPAFAAEAAVPTFSKDIAPLFQRTCDNCHRPGSIAPMSLLTWKDSRPWARSIKEKVATRTMPPWHIDKNVGVKKFKDDPSLTDAEIATISAWVDHGSPEGNPADMPAPLKFTDADKWHIGMPDVIVSMPRPYMLKAKGGDEYYDAEIDPGFKQDMYVSAVETKPDLGFKVIHHATTNLIDADAGYSTYEKTGSGKVDHRTTLSERIGPRARSRLFEMCRVIKMPLIEDFRIRKFSDPHKSTETRSQSAHR